MTDTTTEPKPIPALSVSIMINASIERVWHEITKTGHVQKAVYNTVLETDLVPGHRLRYYSIDKKRVFVVGEVVEVTPPTRFVHTYVLCQKPDPETLVTWELEAVEGGCRVNLTHGGWTTNGPATTGSAWSRQASSPVRSATSTGASPSNAAEAARAESASANVTTRRSGRSSMPTAPSAHSRAAMTAVWSTPRGSTRRSTRWWLR